MKLFVTTAMLVMSLFAVSHSDACEIVLSPRGLPDVHTVLAVGTVTGYSEALKPIEEIGQAPSLLVRVVKVFSGQVSPGVVEVVPLSYSPGCTSTPDSAERLRLVYPVGTEIAISPVVTTPTGGRSKNMLVVESSRNGFVSVLPQDVKRTADGDLDFEHFSNQRGYGPHGTWFLGEFEFGKAVVALRQAKPSDRFRRLMNLVYYDSLLLPQGRAWIEHLIADSRLNQQQREVVVAALEARRQRR